MKDQSEEDTHASCECVFDQFLAAATCKSILNCFHQLLELTGLQHVDHTQFYEQLKDKLKGSWRAHNLWSKLDKKAAHKDYKMRQACSKLKVLIIGAGPCGLRTAIECAFLGVKTVVAEKRDRFTRNNVLHLWPYLITDLRNLGAKKFFGKFCAGAIDHISIRQLQCILLKVALLLGVEVHVNVTYEGLVKPPEDQISGVGWKSKVTPKNHILSEYEFDVLIGADGKRNTLSGFERKEFRGKLAIAITANFINRNTQAEARVEEISGVAFIFNQKFFMNLKESTRIDLENIVYYKNDTHYFVMTAKKASLLEKGVLKEDFSDTVALLDRSNVNQDALMAYAREAADFSTNYQLPSLDFAVNHHGQADVAMFDFTSMFAAENASKFILINGHHLLIGLVGDSLLEPFWPTGSGCARGFLSAFDAAWMIRSWAIGNSPLHVLAERESIYVVLSQTTPSYLKKNYNMYSIDPKTRYPNLNLKAVMPDQVKHLYESDVFDTSESQKSDYVVTSPAKKSKNGGTDSNDLLQWCQKILNTGKYKGVHVVDFTSSWHNGLALCALIHSFRPEIIDYAQLVESDIAVNNELAFSIAEKELGIPPVMTGDDIARCIVPDKLIMVSYLTQFYDLYRHEPLPDFLQIRANARHKTFAEDIKENHLKRSKTAHSSNKRISFLQKLNSRLVRSKKRKEQEENEGLALRNKKLKEIEEDKVELTHHNQLPVEAAGQLQWDNRKENSMNKVREMSGAVSVTAMADILLAKFKNHESKEPVKKMKNQSPCLAVSAASENCFFCHKRVYIMERMSAEGKFFHRCCLKCDHCGMGLRLTNYSCDKDVEPVKFYCCQHAVPEMRIYPRKKRVLVDVEKKNIPDIIITSALGVDSGQTSREKSMQKNMSTQQIRLLTCNHTAERNKNTPERVEFEISFSGEEHSEEEQFAHNLQASLSSEVQLDEDSDSHSDTDSGNGDEVWENAEDLLKYSHLHVAVEEACDLRRTRKEELSWDNCTFSERSYFKSDDAVMSPSEFHEQKDNFKSPVIENIRERKYGQSKDRTQDDDKVVKCILENSVLKKSSNSLQVTDIEKARVSDKKYLEDLVQKNELLERTSTNEAFKKLLQGIHDTSSLKNSASECELSDSNKNRIFIEGHLSPSASRTRRLCMNRHARHRKKKKTPNSKLSDSEARISNSAILNKFSSLSSNHTNTIQSKSAIVRNSFKSKLRDGTDKVLMHQSLGGLRNLKAGAETDENSIHQVFETTTHVSDHFDTSDLLFNRVDDKFVTNRYQKLYSSELCKEVNEKYSKADVEDVSMDSSFSISTPSDSESSVSSIDFDNIEPFQEMMQDDTTTPSLVLGESYVENIKKENLDVAVTLDSCLRKASNSSTLTPASFIQPSGFQVHFSPAHKLLSPSANASAKSTTTNAKASSSDFTPLCRTDERSSSDNYVFHSSVKSNFESQFVNKQPSYTLSLSNTAGLTKIPTQLTNSTSEDSPNGARPHFTECPCSASTLLINSKFLPESLTHCPARKTLLFSSSSWKKSDPTILSTQQIRDMCKADMEVARIQARNRAKLKTDEELGITVGKATYSNKSQVMNRHPLGKTDSDDRYNTSCDRNCISGIILDNNHNRMASLQRASATEGNQLSLSASIMDLKIKEPGIIVVNPPLSTSAHDIDRNQMAQMDSNAEHSISCDINDMCSDRQSNNVSSHQTAASSAIESDQLSDPVPTKGKKKKVKSSKTKSETKDKKSGIKAKKLKSFLALFAKVPKKGTKINQNSNHVILSPDCSHNENSFSSKNKSTDKAPTKNKNEKEIKPSKDKSDCHINQDTDKSSEFCRNLAMRSVFHSDISKRQTKKLSHATNARESLPKFCLKECFDEISDLDESHISVSPVQGRKNKNIEEQVAQYLHKVYQKQQKQAEQKRFRMAQEIQRQLEEVEVRQRDLENRGIAVEKALRGKASGEDECQLMCEWFTLVREKNTLLRYESELMVRAKELELEDRQARLETDFRDRSKHPEDSKTESDLTTEESLLEELLDVVDQRNCLVSMLEEDRLREQKEDSELIEMMSKKGFVLSPLSFDQWQ